MSAKTVSKGAKFAASGDGEIADLSVGPGGSILIDCSFDSGYGETSVSLLPERAALLARAVLEAQGWTFSGTGKAAMLDAPSGEDALSVIEARSVLEAHGWRFGPTEDQANVAVHVGPVETSKVARGHMMGFALGILTEAIADPEMRDALPMVRELLEQAIAASPAVN